MRGWREEIKDMMKVVRGVKEWRDEIRQWKEEIKKEL